MRRLKILLPIILVIGLFIYYTFFINIKNLDCTADIGECEPMLIQEMRSHLPGNLYATRGDIKQVLEADEYISTHRLRYIFPDILSVYIEKSRPDFALRTKEEDSWYSIIGDDGKVLGVEENSYLDYIFTSSLPNPGEVVDDNILKGYKIYRNIRPYFNIQTVELMDSGLFLESERGYQAMLPYNKDPELLIGAVLVVFNRLNTSTEESIMDNRDNQELVNLCSNGCLVDFRFKNPVIKERLK